MSDQKNIWILNHYAGHMFFDQAGRHYWFAKYLSKAGYQVTVFCANTVAHDTQAKHFDSDALFVEQTDETYRIKFVFVNVRTYVGNGVQRVLNMQDFYRNVKKSARAIARAQTKPDIILASSVHPLTMVAGIQLAKKLDIKCICEVRDLWPEAIVAYSKRIKKTSLIAKIMYRGERWIYEKASAVIFTQEGGPQYVIDQGWTEKDGGKIDSKKLYHINNGVDLETFNANLRRYTFNDERFNDSVQFKVVYTGAVRRINNLGIILDAAKLIKNPDVAFYIFGSGDELEMLKERVQNESIRNVTFMGHVERKCIPSIITRSDLNLVHWEMNPLLKVGESYNKSFEYFAAGKPVLYTIRPGYSLVEKYGCGMITEGFTPEDIAVAVDNMVGLSDEEKEKMCLNAKRAARDYDFPQLTNKLIDIFRKYM